MASERHYGIAYPFSDESGDLTFLDMNRNETGDVKSKLLHIIFTPKGQRLRKPEFGTDLIKSIFEPNDSITLENINEDISRQVSMYLPHIKFEGVKVIERSDNGVSVEIDYVTGSGKSARYNKTLINL